MVNPSESQDRTVSNEKMGVISVVGEKVKSHENTDISLILSNLVMPKL